jgi:hypothetical protein
LLYFSPSIDKTNCIHKYPLTNYIKPGIGVIPGVGVTPGVGVIPGVSGVIIPGVM